MADVTFQRKDFCRAREDWELVSDACAGSKEIKARGEKYLPKPNPDDNSKENLDRYKSYLARAVYYNATGQTLRGMVGAAFRKEPVITVPPDMDYVKDDADGQGVSLYQQSQSVLANVLKKGRHALYVDYPAIDGPLSLAAQKSQAIRASIVSVNAEQIVNWRTMQIGGIHRLSQVVISECVDVDTPDGFGANELHQYRVLNLIEGRYVVEIWRKAADDSWVIFDSRIPLDGSGQPWDIIPLVFVGTENNDSNIDPAPLLDLAHLNIAHYRNSADYEDSCFFVGQAQPWMAGLTEDWRDWMQKTGIYIGSRTPILLPEGGSFGIAQAQPNTLVKEAMDAKEKQMVSLGARLIQPGQAVKTATQAQAENEAQHSVLSLCIGNVSEAYEQALAWVARFMGASAEGIQFALNQEFIEHRLDAPTLSAVVAAWQSGILPRSEVFNLFRSGGIVSQDKTDEDLSAEIESDPSGLNLDGTGTGK